MMKWFKSHKTVDEVPEIPVEEIDVRVEGDIEFTSVGFTNYDVYLYTESNLKVTYSTNDYMRTIIVDNVNFIDAVKSSYLDGDTWAYGKGEYLDNLAYDIAIKELRKFINEKDGIIMDELKRKIKMAIINDIENNNLDDRKKEIKSLSKQEINLSFKFTK